MIEVPFESIEENAAKLIGRNWMLVTSGDINRGFNTMTASWGGLGFMWNKDVSFIFVRPQRYTYEFIEKNELYTLSFFDSEYRDALNICGSLSGRTNNKVKESGLTPIVLGGSVAFKEAGLVLVCQKTYFQDIVSDGFIDKNLTEVFYKNNDYHRMYAGIIEKTFIKG